MKTIFLTLLLLLGLSAARPTVITSIHPLFDLTRQVAGEHAEVVRLLPPGLSPHTFDPAPRDVARIAQADLIVMNGGYGIDDWLLGLIEASGSAAPIVNLFEALDFDPVETDHDHEHGHEGEPHDHGEDHHDNDHRDHEHESDHAHGEDHLEDDHDHAHGEDHDDWHDHAHGPVNSHLWLDPVLMAQAVPLIAEALSEVDPENADAYVANAERLVAELEALDRELRETLAPLQGEAFVPFHDAWPYFARRYGLDLVVEIEPFPGREPSPAYLRYALGEIEASGARAIFTEPQLSRRPAEVVAESAGLPLYTMDPVGGTAETESYADLLRFNARVLLEALGE
jgi:zinc transport system substrate-binding protein